VIVNIMTKSQNQGKKNTIETKRCAA